MQSELHTTYTMKPALQPRELTCRCMSGGCELVVRGLCVPADRPSGHRFGQLVFVVNHTEAAVREEKLVSSCTSDL